MKDMEYISMERVASIWGDNLEPNNFSATAHATVNAAIADYLKTVGDGVELPEPAFRLRWHDDGARYTVSKPNIGDTDCYTAEQVKQALAPIAAKLKQAEDVLRMARDAMVNNGIQVNVNSRDYFETITAINQQLWEK